MLISKSEGVNIENNSLVRLCRKFLPVSSRYDGEKFFMKEAGKWALTPLALVLVVVDFTDLIFAVDSIPAVFGITTDSFIVYTSNICAVLGLRSLYFLLANVIDKFVYLKTGLAVVLSFIGFKMLVVDFWEIETAHSLLLVVLILTVSIIASLRHSIKDPVKT